MAIGICVRSGFLPTDTKGVYGGSFSMLSLVYPVADIIEEKHPDIFEKAYHSVEMGNVYFDSLSAEEFKSAYDLTLVEFERFLQQYPTVEDRQAERGKWENWKKYMKLLEEDLRLKHQ